MLYIVFVLALLMTILYFTHPYFLLKRKYGGQDLFAILNEEGVEKPVKLISRGVFSILHSLVYYPMIFVVLPLVILYALSNEIGLRFISLIAAGIVAYTIFRTGYTLWQVITGHKGKAKIQTPDGKRYEGQLVSEETITTVDVRIQDLNPDIPYASGILLDEATEFIRIVSADGVKVIRKDHPFGRLDIKKRKISEATIRLKDGTEKKGRRSLILGENPIKEFLGTLPRFALTIYLWYLVYVLVS